MSDEKQNQSSSKSALDRGESDEFVLPVPPPPPPPRNAAGITGKSAVLRETSSPTDTALPPVKECIPECDDKRNISGATLESDVREYFVKPSSNTLVTTLVCAIVFLLIVITIEYNQTPTSKTYSRSSPVDKEGELTAAREEIDATQAKLDQIKKKTEDLIEQLTQKSKNLENQLKTSRADTDAKMASLLQKSKIAESEKSQLIAELTQVKARLRDGPQPALSQPAPVHQEPLSAQPTVARQVYRSYRVTRVLDGDTLNVRSGPGTNFPPIIALQNGTVVAVIGNSEMNGPDEWFPCLLNVSRVDSVSGTKQVSEQKGWVNSVFLAPLTNE